MAELVITKDNFEEEILKADKPAIVDFAEEFDGKYVVGKVNVDDEEELAEQFNIMSIPTIKVFKGGQEAASALGVQTKEKLLELIGE